MSRDIWDPVTYAVYADERSRPFIELISRVGAVDPDYVVDAGCGSGELTAQLATRWPRATVEGFDSSPAMITKARQLDTSVRFAVADVATWRPDRPVDVIVSNAVLQWVPDHRSVLEHWMEALAPGGWLAFQVPGNFDAPSHFAIRELCASRTWSDQLGDYGRGVPVDDPVEYVDLLNQGGTQVDAWETTYIHVLKGEDPVLNWVSGTALRPILDRLDQGDRRRFTSELGEMLARLYPARSYGTPFPFRRIFVVAQK
ncbi:trans-aconitate 2-methyltransferase [Actinomadura sp. ATCC 31491]|uniref:Trans-aconitate 2-methyltransferase n=1 Tax=Actinomadura luzonensis TaxID=2805427 RepID=A0ABT0FLN5_9ACTN|nr:trans-aconitate 2-methyltransferase [Actinomadura luzonensis]MCK2213237.1 trans-aconitate 2-methyltransferase [Actinomadura luzonensis]